MYNETPFFQHYTPLSSYEGYEVTPNPTSSTVASTTAPSTSRDKFEPSNPIYPLPVPNRPVGSQPSAADKAKYQQAIESNIVDMPQSCQGPSKISPADIFTKAEALAKATGSDQTCIKATDNKVKTNSSSFGAKAEMSALFVDVSASISGQHSETEQQQSNFQSGCGSSLTNAANVSIKEEQMQCIINNVSQSTTMGVNIGQTVNISTTAPSESEIAAKAAIVNNAQKYKSELSITYAQLVASAVIAGAKPEAITLLTDFGKAAIKLALAADAELVSTYSRDMEITGLEITQTTNAQLKLSVQLSTSAQASLTSIAQSISKDTAAQALANTFGTSVLDPNVKQAASNATERNLASAASSLSNIMNNTSIQMSGNQNVTISCPGKLTLKNTKFDQNFVCSVMASALTNQAIANGMSAASSFLNETVKTQTVDNKVAGLDDLQKAMGDTNAKAIDAGNKPVVTAGIKDSIIKYIIAAVIGIAVLFLLYKLFAGKNGKDGGSIFSPDTINAAANAMKNFKK